MTETTRRALREWNADQLEAELTRMRDKMAELEDIAVNDEMSGWMWADMNDWTTDIDNELARRKTATEQAA